MTRLQRIAWLAEHAHYTSPSRVGRVVQQIEKLAKQPSEALTVAYETSQIDGAHHKAWSIDQMVRALTGDGYDAWVAEYCAGGKYAWDTGIAP